MSHITQKLILVKLSVCEFQYAFFRSVCYTACSYSIFLQVHDEEMLIEKNEMSKDDLKISGWEDLPF